MYDINDIFKQKNYSAYPRDLVDKEKAVRYGGYCYCDVAVCVSVMVTYRAQTTESIIMRPSPDCSPAILVFLYQICTWQLEGITSLGALNVMA